MQHYCEVILIRPVAPRQEHFTRCFERNPIRICCITNQTFAVPHTDHTSFSGQIRRLDWYLRNTTGRGLRDSLFNGLPAKITMDNGDA